jgi:hypothetical protein
MPRLREERRHLAAVVHAGVFGRRDAALVIVARPV